MDKRPNPLAGDLESLRQANLSKVLTHLCQHAPVSRAGLAELTGLNRATITRLVRQLIDHGFVQETGLDSARSGHPSILLQLNPDAGYIIGADLGIQFSSVILTNLEAAIVWRQEVQNKEGEALEAVWKKVLRLICRAIEKARESNHCILGLGMSLPGLVDAGRGVLLYGPDEKWNNAPVRQWLVEQFDFPVLVDNKTNLAALCESYFGAGRSGEYVLYINFGANVSAGIVIGEKIVPGASGLAGGVGHMTIDPNGPHCTCGNNGCWETFVSTPALLQRVRQAIQAGKPSQLVEFGDEPCEELSIPIIAEASRQGDSVALAALQETAKFLGIGIANLINALNPDKVVLGGYFSHTHEFMLSVVQEVVHKRALYWSREAAEIVVAKHEQDASLLGAVARVYSQILLNPADSFKAILNKVSPSLEWEGSPSEL